MPKYRESPLSKLIMTEVSRNLRNIFFPKIPPIMKIEVGFFSGKKSFLQIFQNTANFLYPNFISKKKTKKSENLFFAEKSACYLWGFGFFFPKYPRFWNLKSDFFPVKKCFSQIFQIAAHLFHLNLISEKTPKKSENIFWSVGREGGREGAHYKTSGSSKIAFLSRFPAHQGTSLRSWF